MKRRISTSTRQTEILHFVQNDKKAGYRIIPADYKDIQAKLKGKILRLFTKQNTLNCIDYFLLAPYDNIVSVLIDEKGNRMISKEQFDKEIQNIVKQLIHLYRPSKVILFGSLAKGIINQGTDIDLFIIKSEVPEFGVDRIRQLDTIINYKLATDFIVYTPEEVEQRLKLGDPFVKSILEEGKVLYDAA